MIKEETEEEEMALEEEGETITNTVENELKDGMQVSCGGVLSEIKKVLTKTNNKEMAILKIEDLYGNFDVMLVPNVYDKYKHKLVEDALVSVYGKLSIRDGERPIIVVSNLNFWAIDESEPVEIKEEKKEVPKTLYLRYNTQDGTIHPQILSILRNYVGGTPVIIKCTGLDKSFKLSFKTNANNYLLNELNAILSEEDIKLL